MKIDFKKIPTSGINFETCSDDIKFYGVATKIQNNLVKCTGTIEGSFVHPCDRCGEEFDVFIKEDVELYASEGIYSESEELLDLIEFFNDFIDFDTMLQGEIESLKSDYLYCDKCK
ncbi:MAG: DNA-binding protein [Sulfurospirillaceae bacterium]|nr:DNA-binding protein [Sulfurospirillaceae bacterium]